MARVAAHVDQHEAAARLAIKQHVGVGAVAAVREIDARTKVMQEGGEAHAEEAAHLEARHVHDAGGREHRHDPRPLRRCSEACRPRPVALIFACSEAEREVLAGQLPAPRPVRRVVREAHP